MTDDDEVTDQEVPDRGPTASASLIGGAGVLFGGRLAGAALSLTGTLLIAAELGKQQFGSFSFIFNLLGLLGLFADFETTRVVMAELGRSNDDDEVSSIASRFIVFRFVLGSVTYLSALAIVWIGPYSSIEIQGTAIGGLSLLIASAAWSLISVCQAKQWLRTVAAAMFGGQVVQFIIIIVLNSTGHGSLLRYIVPFVVSDVVVFFVILTVIRKSVRVRPFIDFDSWRRWLVEAAPLAIGTAMAAMYFRIDSLMLTLVLDGPASRDAVAIYQIGYKFSDLIAFLAPALIAAMLPALVQTWPRDPAGFHRTVRQSVVVVFVISAFAIVAFAVFADPLIRWLLDDSYRSAHTPARWLVVGQVLNLFTQIVYVCLITANRRKFYPVVTFCGLVINVGLNLMFIPRYGVNGSAVSTVVTEIIVLALLVGQVVDLPLRPLPTRSIAIASCAALASGAVGYLMLQATPWPIAGLATALTYIALLHIGNVDGPGGLKGLVARSRFVSAD